MLANAVTVPAAEALARSRYSANQRRRTRPSEPSLEELCQEAGHMRGPIRGPLRDAMDRIPPEKRVMAAVSQWEIRMIPAKKPKAERPQPLPE